MKRKEIDVQAQVKALKGKSTQREKDAASSLLVQRFNESLFYFILKMVRNQEDAEDILQQVWAKAFNRIAQYKPTHAFSTWLFKIATNHIIDVNRKRTLNVISLDTPLTTEVTEDDQMRPRELMMNMADYAPTPDEQMQLDARKEMCWELIEMLNPKLKELVVLRYINQLSYEEIAEQTNQPLGTVKGNLYRAKEKLAAFAMDYNLQEQY
jgi:RNA polymerase sigma factor (sigma-70 family)